MFKEYRFMNEENVKIARIKKSCHVGKIVSNIFCIIAIVGIAMSIFSAVTIFSMGRKFDDFITKAEEEGYVDNSNQIGSVSSFVISLGCVDNFDSDIPAVKAALEDHPYCVVYGTFCVISGVCCVILAVMLKLISSVFALIEKEATPFNDKVKKRVTGVLIVTSVLLFLTEGAGFALLGALVTWAVNSILDYGKTLQVQADETL